MQYFATLETQELLSKLEEKIKDFNTYIDSTGLSRKWTRSENIYFGKHQGEDGVGSYSINDAGQDGTMSTVTVNKFRSLIKHNLSYTITQKPAWDPKAKNSDLKSMQQARLAGNILDAYMTEKRMSRHMNQAAERSLVCDKAFVYVTWDPAKGEEYATEPALDDEGKQILDENGKPKLKIVYEGDVEACSKGPHDVMYDPRLKDWHKKRWVIVRDYENKWDLAARHPKQAEAIVKISAQDELAYFSSSHKSTNTEKSEQDLIPVYHFYHLRTDGVPSGRYTKFLNNQISLYDGPIQYDILPVFRITPGEQFDSAEGYTDAYDQMALQEALNVFYSIAFSNLQAFAGQKLWLPEGCEISSSQLDDGMVILKGGLPNTEPKILNLTGIPPELLKVIELFTQSMVEGMGLNSVVTGDPEHGLKSGTALGRMQAMAIQYASNFQRGWAELSEDVAGFVIWLIANFAKTRRMISVAGVKNKGAMTSFSGEDLNGIKGVSVDLGNPLSRTAAGRIEFGNMLYEKGEINGRELVQIYQTGSADSIMEDKQTDVEAVQKENELLRDGKPVKAMVGDAHLYHMDKHRAVVNDPQLRSMAAQGDPLANQIINEATLHIMWHSYLYNTQDPIFSVICKEPPAPVRMIAQLPPGQEMSLDQTQMPPPLMPPPPPIPMMGPGPEGPMPPPPGGEPIPPPPGPPGPAEPPPLPPVPPAPMAA